MKKPSPPTKSYVEYFTTTYAEKVRGRVDLEKVAGEETVARFLSS